MSKSNCRVCGLFIEDPPWGDDDCYPTYEICSCCGVEFGYQDYTLESTRDYRDKWIKNGAKWFRSQDKPYYWDLDKQMLNIPYKYR